MTLRESVYRALGFFIDKDEKVSTYMKRLDHDGKLDEKNKLKILMILADKIEELEIN